MVQNTTGAVKENGDCFTVVSDRQVKDEKWLAERRATRALGASDVVALLGLSPFEKSPLQLYAEFVNPQSWKPSYVQRVGQRVESLALEMLGEHLGAPVIQEHRLLRSRQYPELMASPDGWVDFFDAPPAEAKYTTWRMEEWEDGRVPADAFVQSQVTQLVVGRDRGFVVGMFPHSGPHPREFVLDSKYLLDVVLPKVREFLRRVELKSPPLEDGVDWAAEATKDALIRCYKPTGRVIDSRQLSQEDLEMVLKLDAIERAAASNKDGAEEQVNEARNRIRAFMGDAVRLELPDGSRWDFTPRSAPTFDIPPAVKAQYRTEGTTRQLRRYEAPKAKGVEVNVTRK